MSTLLHDLRQGLRALRRAPGFSAVALITLALGIGANVAIFSVVHGVLLRPLPYHAPEELVYVTTGFPTLELTDFWLSAPEVVELREQAACFSALGAWTDGADNHAGVDTAPLLVPTRYATADLLPMLGVQPALGRLFGPEHSLPGAEPVVLVTHALWTQRWGADPDLVGRELRVDGSAVRVIGVLPEDFRMGAEEGVEAWRPLGLDPANPGPRSSHWMRCLARLAPGQDLDAARTTLEALQITWAEELAGQHSLDPVDHPLELTSFVEHEVGGVRPALLVLLGAVGFVLLIACANVANLLLARAEVRQKEIAVRVALGAGRWRLLRQLLTESVLLSLLGGALGVVLAQVGVRVLLDTWSSAVPRAHEVGLDLTVLGVSLALALVTGLVFGLAPALQLLRTKVAAQLKDGGRGATVGRARLRSRSLLVIAETGLAVVLVVGAGLMIRSFATLSAVDPGFDATHTLSLSVSLVGNDYPAPDDVVSFFDDVHQRVAELPGVESAAWVTGPPMLGRHIANSFQLEGYVPQPDDPPLNCDYQKIVSPEFFETAGIALRQGRRLDRADRAGAEVVVVINRALAEKFFRDSDPLGRRVLCNFQLAPDGSPRWSTIVGVVDDVAERSLDSEVATKMYFARAQQIEARGGLARQMSLLVRTRGDPLELRDAVTAAIWARDPELPVADVQTMQQVVDESLAAPRFLTLLMSLFAVVALLLAAVGTYGVTSYSVSRRTHELGVRLALGARPAQLLRMVLRQSFALVVIGAALGVGAALTLTHSIESQLYGVEAVDPPTYVVVVTVLLGTALLACFLPARRATRVDPAVALRCE